MKRLWRWLYGESAADRLRREALIVHRAQQEAAWELRRDWYATAVQSAATAGRFRVLAEAGDTDLFRVGGPGHRWAVSMGFKVEVSLSVFGHYATLDW